MVQRVKSSQFIVATQFIGRCPTFVTILHFLKIFQKSSVSLPIFHRFLSLFVKLLFSISYISFVIFPGFCFVHFLIIPGVDIFFY